MRAGDDLFFTPGGSFTTPSGGFTGFVDEVQNDGGAGGVGDLRQAVFNATSITLIGNIDGDTLFGSNGNDALDGRGGADTMDGGAGNDFFTVDNAGDVIVEAAGQGTNDRARTSVSYTLGAGQQVELLSTFGSGTTTVIHLGGNELANALEGNAADNILNGNGGADTLRGFAGNDSFFVNVMGDTIVEAAGQGTDNANVSASYTLGVDVSVETLRTTNAAGTTTLAARAEQRARVRRIGVLVPIPSSDPDLKRRQAMFACRGDADLSAAAAPTCRNGRPPGDAP